MVDKFDKQPVCCVFVAVWASEVTNPTNDNLWSKIENNNFQDPEVMFLNVLFKPHIIKFTVIEDKPAYVDI